MQAAEAPPPPARRRPLWPWVAVAALLALALLGWLGVRQAQAIFHAPGPLRTDKPLVIGRGGTDAVAAQLREAGIIADPRAFGLAAWLTREAGPLRSGEFLFVADSSLAEVLTTLRTARPVQRRLTIPEGLTARQIAALLDREPGLTGPLPAIAEAALLPDTYAFQWGDPRAGLIRRAEAAMAAALAEAWASRPADHPLRTARELMILASIVERETAKPEERPRVAAVFLNRLRRGMRLQSDPTVIYAVAEGGALDRPLTRADLDRDHPFNTYRIPGLPPGPIAAPGREALAAVLRPAATEDLYFVADGSGGHAFARTLEEHNRNVARWREIERQRGATR
jgi:UPF0755 protein